MRVTVERTDLLRSLAHVHRVVERRNTIPILGNVLLTSKDAELSLRATDLDVEVIETVPVEAAPGGAATVPAQLFYDIVRKLPEGSQIVLATDPDRNAFMTIHAGRSEFSLQTLPATDFPDIAGGELTHRFTVAAGDFKRLIDKTQFAISTEETRYYLNGIYLHAVQSGNRLMLRAVATDGHRLAQYELAAPPGTEGMPGIIVPRKTVGEVQRLIDGSSSELTVEVSASKIRLSLDGIVLTSKLIDGSFPDYSRVIPFANSKTLEVGKKDLEEAVDRVSTVASERGRAVKLALSAGRLVLSVSNAEQGFATEAIEVGYDADPLDIGFNSRYLLDIAAQIDGDVAVLKLADPSSPTLFASKERNGALYVLMPTRV